MSKHAGESDYIHPQSREIALFAHNALSGMRCHDWDHTLRVLHNARKLIVLEHAQADEPVIELAVLLHDIARPTELRQGRKQVCHAQLGAEMVPGILRQFKVDDIWIEPVQEAVRRHRYRSDCAPRTLAEKIVYDADKLDALGAAGIARAFYFAGKIGSRLHNTQEEALAGTEFSPEDTAYREYLIKLKNLPEKMMTEGGKALAETRLEFVTQFFDRLNQEVFDT